MRLLNHLPVFCAERAAVHRSSDVELGPPGRMNITPRTGGLRYPLHLSSDIMLDVRDATHGLLY